MPSSLSAQPELRGFLTFLFCAWQAVRAGSVQLWCRPGGGAKLWRFQLEGLQEVFHLAREPLHSLRLDAFTGLTDWVYSLEQCLWPAYSSRQGKPCTMLAT